VAELEARAATLRALEPVAARHDSLRDVEIPALKAKVAELEDEVGRMLDEESEAAKEEAAAGTHHAEAADAMQDAVQPLARLAAEVAERHAEVEGLRATVRTLDATRSVADVDSDLAKEEAKRATLERARDTATTGLSRLRDAVAALRSELHREREEVLRLGAAVERRVALEAQQRELIEARDALVGAVVQARRAREPLEKQKAELEAAREAARRSAAAAENKLEAALRELQTRETQLEGRERALAEYEARGGAAATARAQEKTATLRSKAAVKEEERTALEAELANLTTEVANNERFEHQMHDILAYKKSAAEQEELSADLDRYGEALAAQGDRNALLRKVAELRASIQELRSEADKSEGALETVQETAAAAGADLEAPEYNDIDGKHRRAVIEVRTTEMASHDLDKFHKALEKALLAFHTGKMADINRIVKELWQKTYRNSDIDYIQIRADTEGSANRSYNYRVVMVCGGAELDMRGRCSAGQRVLASLVIRLALAESFCLNCGILALDEPTTNLDADNAQSLAEALKAIMAARRDQENFQLIVITHDEAFAKHIGTREHAEYMWRIFKDENQHSSVRKEIIAD
jgi:DNA repair protein RAD50